MSRERNYSSLTTLGEPILVPHPGLESGEYVVRNFWTALHIILQFSLPSNRSLKEYVQIFIVLQKCIFRMLEKIQDGFEEWDQIPSKMSLLVFLPSSCPPQPLEVPSVSIGFNVAGNNIDLLKERHPNLPVLSILERNQPPGKVFGVGGATETLAYTYKAPPGRAGGNFRLLLVSLTLEIMTMETTPVRMCDESKRLVELLRDKHRVLVSLDLTPPGPKHLQQHGRYPKLTTRTRW